MEKSKRQLEIEARMAADPIAQAIGRTDIDYSDPDQLPTAPRAIQVAPFKAAHEAKYPADVLDALFAAGEITLEQLERLRRETKQ